MEPNQLFFDYLAKFIPLEEEEFKSVIQPRIQLRRFKKKEIISEAGQVERFANFVGQGLVRKYFRKEDEELITQIAHEGHLIYSQASLNNQSPSHYFLEAIEATTLVSIEFGDLNAIFGSNAKMERMGRLVATDVTVINERWQMMMLKMTPRERFLEFVRRNPELVQRVPQKFLASLLNIQPETFSRFKHLLKPPGNESTANNVSEH